MSYSIGYWSCDLTKVRKRYFCKCCGEEILQEINDLYENLCFKCYKNKNKQFFTENILQD